MKVHNGLASRFAIVYTNIETVRITFIHQDSLHLVNQIEKRYLFFSISLKEGRYVPLWDDQAMTRRNGEAVINRKSLVILEYYSWIIKITKRTAHLSSQQMYF